MNADTELKNRVFEILEQTLDISEEKLDRASKTVKDHPNFAGDPGTWIMAQYPNGRQPDIQNRLIVELIENKVLSGHDFTKWMIEHSTTSLGRMHRDLGGITILDVAIQNNLPKDLLNDLTVRTLEQTSELSNPYVYTFEDLPPYFFKYPKQLAQAYQIHHKAFQKYLDDHPEIKVRLQKQGINIDFWEQELTYDSIFKQIKPISEKIESARNKSASGSDSLFKNLSKPQATHKTHDPGDAPTMDQYKDNNVLQKRLGRNVNIFLFRQEFDRVAAKAGAQTRKGRRHLVFSGPPGTGKTTLARVLGRHFKDIGLLEQGHVVETTATALIGKYVGHTADHMRKAVEAAKGGVLFIDEIYHFVKDEQFGSDAVNQLIALMENERENFILIVAGYKKDNDDFIALNPGLRDRFGDEFMFDHFSRPELQKILTLHLERKRLSMEDQAIDAFLDCLEEDRSENPRLYANARTLEKLLEAIISQHAFLFNSQLNSDDFNASDENHRKKLLTLTMASVNHVIRELQEDQFQKDNIIGFHTRLKPQFA